MKIFDQYKNGDIFFTLMYADEDLQIPVIQTLVFLHKHKKENGSTCFIFREISSKNNEDKFFINEENIEELLLTKSELLQKLTRIGSG